MGTTTKGKRLVEKLRLRFPEVKEMPLATGDKLYWVRCVICATLWVATKDEDTNGICHDLRCLDSFQAKVIRAT